MFSILFRFSWVASETGIVLVAILAFAVADLVVRFWMRTRRLAAVPLLFVDVLFLTDFLCLFGMVLVYDSRFCNQAGTTLRRVPVDLQHLLTVKRQCLSESGMNPATGMNPLREQEEDRRGGLVYIILSIRCHHLRSYGGGDRYRTDG